MSRGGGSKGGSGFSRGGRGRASSPAPKGKVNGGKAVQYAIKNAAGETKYVGSTNNPRARAAEHTASGKLGPGDKLKVESRAVPRPQAERLEASKLSQHRQETGTNPQHNKTNDGKFHR